ncbi:MAG: AI-2E family transporter [Actinomycetota bacterium]|nr:AI-2E family transporter [Actinomycetota bacterium]
MADEPETHGDGEAPSIEEVVAEAAEPEAVAAAEAAILRLHGDPGEASPFGRPGHPLPLDSPFRLGFVGALGVAAALLLVRVVLAAAPILLLVGMALFFAIGLDPAVSALQRRGLRRGWAVFAIVAAVVSVLVLFAVAAAPPLLSQAAGLRTELPEYVMRLERDNRVVRELDERFGLVERLQALLSGESVSGAPTGDSGFGGAAIGGVVEVARSVFAAFASTLTVAVLSLYFLASLSSLKQTAYRLVPRSRRERSALLADEVLDRIGGYLLGNLATSIIAGTASFVFFVSAGLPYPFPLAVVIALTGLIPLVGATIGSVVAVLVAFLVSVPVGIATVAFAFVYQQFENFVLAPRIMKRTIDVSPLATIVAALIGAALLGIFGALLAVPVAASIQIIGRHVVLPRQEAA